MKKFFFLLMFIAFILYVCNRSVENNSIYEEKGVFISYIDYSILKGKNKNEMKHIISKMIDNIDSFGLNSVILQTNPFSDAIYYSKIYEPSHVVVDRGGDPLPLDILQYFINVAKEKNIKVYAWMNPYRIRTSNIEINKNAYYYKWFNTDNIEVSNKGIFLNPASSEVLDYISKGLRELCENYEIEGIIYDDYYYPNETIDLNTYKKSNSKKSLKQYRIDNINKLIETSYKTIKNVNKSIKFGLSPSGNIEYNLNTEYLDVKTIVSSDYIDMIIPQLYYGFNNSNKPYMDTLNSWNNLNKKNKDLYVALSLYKAGKVDKYAGTGKNEWLKNTDIIRRQIIVSRNINNYKGFYIFRYEYLFDIYSDDSLNKEVNNLRSLIRK